MCRWVYKKVFLTGKKKEANIASPLSSQKVSSILEELIWTFVIGEGEWLVDSNGIQICKLDFLLTDTKYTTVARA